MTRIGAFLAFSALVVGLLVSAAEASAAERGPVTNLPIPRFVSLKASEANVRRGPSLTHRIDWVFQRRDMPLTVVGEFEHWRRVQDRDGVGGWVHYSLISGARTGIVERDLAPVFTRAVPDAQVRARLEAGVIVNLDQCGPAWCKVKVGRHKGWMEKSALWGVRSSETFD